VLVDPFLGVHTSAVYWPGVVVLLIAAGPTKVGTYAYINPVVAVVVGYLLGGEVLNLRTATGIVPDRIHHAGCT